jgi:Domain of unknown function (DUF5679)
VLTPASRSASHPPFAVRGPIPSLHQAFAWAPLGEGGSMANYEGYCVKCREKREFDGEVVEMANGRRSAKGKCPVCGTGMNRILGKDA